MNSCVALVVAAGRGERVGGAVPKQYRLLAGQPVLRHSVERLLAYPGISAVRVVIASEHRELYEAATAGLDLLPPVLGGANRQSSVRLGLESLEELTPDTVLIHDAARPLLPSALIGRVVAALDHHPAVLPVLPLVDTIKRLDGDIVAEDVDRTELARAQTPQGFHFQAILATHRRFAGLAVTDDAALAHGAGMPVVTVHGDERNAKITHSHDHERLEATLTVRGPRWRTGLGFDVHRLVPGRPLILCGVTLPFELGLDGHSDADVALHAITDAVLGTIGAGDIGTHFPPSDPRWKDAASDRFLRHALDLLAAHGGRLEHVDLTLICERPKIGPHRDAMRARLAAIAGLAVDATSIKATTSEGLGFTGRGEGIAAQAVVTCAFAGR